MPCLLVVCSSVLAHPAKQAAAPATDLSWLWAALIGVVGGVVGAVVGGTVGGRYVLRAGQQQWLRDREDARKDRSQQAAMAIAESAASMEDAVVTWVAR